MFVINDSLNMFRLRFDDLIEVKYQTFGVIEVSDLSAQSWQKDVTHIFEKN